MSQLTHTEVPFTKRVFPITIVLDQVMDKMNIAGIARLADAFGVKSIILLENNISPTHDMIKKSRHTLDRSVTIVHSTYSIYLDILASQQSIIPMAIEITHNSQDIASMQNDIKLSPSNSIHIILGSERHGISEKILSQSKYTYHIPMYGQNSSMNVCSACAIALFALVQTMNNP